MTSTLPVNGATGGSSLALPPLAASMATAVCIIVDGSGDAPWRIEACNRSWLDLSARLGAGAIGGRLDSVFPGLPGVWMPASPDRPAVTYTAVAARETSVGATTWFDLECVAYESDQGGAPGAVLILARDVTDALLARREAEDAQSVISATDARLILAQEATGIGIWQWDLETGTPSWSPGQFRLFGLNPAEDSLPSLPAVIEAIHPDDRELVTKAGVALKTKAAQADGARAVDQFEMRIRRADTGETRWILVALRVTAWGPDGRPRLVSGVNIDVTNHRIAQETVRESEARLRLAVDAAGLFAWDWDVPSGRVTWMDGLEAALGLEPGSFGGTVDAFRALVHPDDAAMVAAALGRAMRGEDARYKAEFRMRRADGTWRWTCSHAVVLRDAKGVAIRLVGVDFDISERRLAEAALRDSETRLRLALEAGELGAWELDPATGRHAWDETMDRLMRLPADALGGEHRKWLNLIHPDDRDRVGAARAHALRTGLPYRQVFRIRRGDGEERIIASRAIVTPNGRMVGVAEDITGASEAEALVLESEQRFQGLFESTYQFTGLLAVDGTILKANRAALEFAGITSAQVAGRKAWDSIWFSGTPDVAGQIARAVASAREGRFVRCEQAVQGVSRKAIVDISLRPVRDKSGAVILLVAEGRDISDRITAQASLQSATQSLLLALEAGGMATWDIDLARGTGQWSASLFTLIGLPPDPDGHARVDAWRALVNPADLPAIDRAFAASLHGGAYLSEHRLRRADTGEERWFAARGCVLRDIAGKPERFLGVYQDVTETRHAEPAPAPPQQPAQGSAEIRAGSIDVSGMVAANDDANRRVGYLETLLAERTRALSDAGQELTTEIRRRTEITAAFVQAQKLEALGQLTGSVAHDFNNVLAAIVGSYSLIRRRSQSLETLAIVERGEQAAARAARLIGKLLSFARREMPAPELLNVVGVLRELEDLIRHAAGPTVTCRFELPDTVWPVLADPHQLGIAVLNLAVNARDAMPQGGTIEVSVRNVQGQTANITDAKIAGHVAIAVRDTGQGMTPDVLARARDAFYTTKPAGQGTGLGLPMVLGFAQASGGALTIDSTADAGTNVTITLPRAAILPSSPERKLALRRISAPSFALHGDANILLVEDDDQVRPLTALFLRDLGYMVLEAANAEAAMAIVHAVPHIHLLITDIHLPGDDGVSLARRLRIERPALPVLFMTGRAEGAAVPDNATILQKPFADTVLAKAVLKTLGRKVAIHPAQAEPLLSRLRSPALRDLLMDWHLAKADGEGYPRIGLLEPAVHGLAENSFSVAVEFSDPPLFHYVSVGKALIEELVRARGSALVSPDYDGAEIIGTLDGVYRRCARTRAPVYQTAQFSFGEGDAFHFERLILPASEDGETVTHLLGIVLFNAQSHKTS